MRWIIYPSLVGFCNFNDHSLFSSPRSLFSAIATSVDVERAFSAGWCAVSQYRHSLKDEKIWASLLLSSRFRQGLVNVDTLVKYHQQQASRSGKLKGSGVMEKAQLDQMKDLEDCDSSNEMLELDQ